MGAAKPPLPSEVRVLLDAEREIPPLAASVRARVVGRARATSVAGWVTPRAGLGSVSRARWALALAAVGIATAAVGATGYLIGTRYEGTPTDPAETTTHVVVAVPDPDTSAPVAAEASPSPPP